MVGEFEDEIYVGSWDGDVKGFGIVVEESESNDIRSEGVVVNVVIDGEENDWEEVVGIKNRVEVENCENNDE